jgi:hypothetical protein
MWDELKIVKDLEETTSGLLETLLQVVRGMPEENYVAAKIIFPVLINPFLNKIFDDWFACITHGTEVLSRVT